MRVPALLCLLVALACSPPEEVEVCDRTGPNPTPCKNPVVLVPGLGGSILDVLYEDSYRPPNEVCEPEERNQWSSGIGRSPLLLTSSLSSGRWEAGDHPSSSAFGS